MRIVIEQMAPMLEMENEPDEKLLVEENMGIHGNKMKPAVEDGKDVRC